jgi:hypothetical protein
MSSPAQTTVQAILVYLRPAPRRALLMALADLGVFVCERPDATDAGMFARMRGARLAFVVGDVDSETVACVSDLTGSGCVTVVWVPSAPAIRDTRIPGAAAVIEEQHLGPASAPVLARAVAEARALTFGAPEPAPRLVFGDLVFDPLTPAIMGAGKIRPLSRAEHAVLSRLQAAHGEPVEAASLVDAASVPGHHPPPGFLKSVVLRLRCKARELGGDASRLETVRGVGYVLYR